MENQAPSRQHLNRALYSAAIIVCVCSLLSAINLLKGVDLADEGFLWYGSQRVLHGELPMRDFISYDVGKYLWSAGLMLLRNNDGIVTVRIASLLFLNLGIFACYLILRKCPCGLNWRTSAFLAVVVFFLITSVRTHIIDNTAALLLVASLARLLSFPQPKNFLLFGIMVGLSATVGRHHGFYGFVSFILALGLLYSARTRIELPASILSWVLGLAIGYTPVEALFLFAPTFGKSFLDLLFFTISHQNIPLPTPSPWDAFAKPSHPLYVFHAFVLAILFMVLPVFDVIGFGFVFLSAMKSKLIRRPLLVASILLSIPYTHYAFARADGAHMVFGFIPFTIAVLLALGLDKGRKSWFELAGITAFTIVICLFAAWLHPFIDARIQGGWRKVQIGADRLWAPQETAKTVEEEIGLVEKYAGLSHEFLAEPFLPGLYCIFRTKSPLWEIYSIHQQSKEEADKEIARLVDADPKLVLIRNFPLDGLEERSYSRNHQYIYNYVLENFRKVDALPDQPDLGVFVK